MTSTRRQVQPAAQPQCLHPAYHAHYAHPANRPQVVPPVPGHTPTAGRQFKITKNWVIGFLILMIAGLGGVLSDKDAEIADLKAKIHSSQTAPAAKVTPAPATTDLTTKINACTKIQDKALQATCLQLVLGG